MTKRQERDDAAQLEQLRTPAGIAGSGRLRYAAAMYFFARGLMSDEELEVFRICSPLDHEHPGRLLRDRGLSGSAAKWLEKGPIADNKRSSR